MYAASKSPSNEVGLTVPYPLFVTRLVTLLHASLIITSLSLAVCVFDRSLFSWHPVLMSLGFILFMAQGVVAAVMFRQLEPGLERVHAIRRHAWIQLRAVLCAAAGFAVIYSNKVIHGKPHFKSWHGKLGLASMVLGVLTPLVGVVSFKSLGFLQKFPEHMQPGIKAIHRQMGLLTWLLAMFTIELALPHKAVNKGLLTRCWQAGVGMMCVVMVLIHWQARSKLKEQFENFSKAR